MIGVESRNMRGGELNRSAATVRPPMNKSARAAVKSFVLKMICDSDPTL
jgi:hypothetical protein